MPQSDAVAKALSSARSALSDANKKFPAPKPTVSPAPTAAPKAAAPTTGDELAAKRANVQQYTASLPKMHKGGEIPADGAYMLKKGEHVLTAPEAARAKKHALMHAGMRSLATIGKKQMAGGTSGEPTKMDKPMTGHSVAVKHIKVRPEMNQGAKSSHTEGNKMPTLRGSRPAGVTAPHGRSTTNAMSKIRPEGAIKRDAASVAKS